MIGSQQSGRLQYDSIRIVKPRPPQVTTAAARDVTYSVAKSVDYTRLWAYFSVKSLINIGSCGFLMLLLKCCYLFGLTSCSMSCRADIFDMLFKRRIVCFLADLLGGAEPRDPHTHRSS